MNETIGDRISYLRHKKNLSGTDIYRLTGITPSMLSRLENNTKTELSSEYVLKLSELFGVSCDYLICGKTD